MTEEIDMRTKHMLALTFVFAVALAGCAVPAGPASPAQPAATVDQPTMTPAPLATPTDRDRRD